MGQGECDPKVFTKDHIRSRNALTIYVTHIPQCEVNHWFESGRDGLLNLYNSRVCEIFMKTQDV